MRLVRLFSSSSALVLCVTGAAKLIGSAGHQKILLATDPVAGLSVGRLILLVGLIELIIAIVCILDKGAWLSVTLIGWLSTNFLAYRVVLSLNGSHEPCSCLGNVTDSLHISPQAADELMKIVLGYLLIGSYAAWFWLWRQDKKRIGSPPSTEWMNRQSN